MYDPIEALIDRARYLGANGTLPSQQVFLELAAALSAAHTVIEEAKANVTMYPEETLTPGIEYELVRKEFMTRLRTALSKFPSGEEEGR